jgi:hypothetical protein
MFSIFFNRIIFDLKFNFFFIRKNPTRLTTLIITANNVTNERIEGYLKFEITANGSYTYEFLDEFALQQQKRIS